MALIGKQAPSFSVEALEKGERKSISLSDYKDDYVVFFYYPKDDTGVCGSEVHAFQRRIDEFSSRGVKLIGASIDTMESHMQWAAKPVSEGGIGEVSYPIIADDSKKIAADYDVMPAGWEQNENAVSYRGLFIIDKTGTVRHQLINDFALGRSIDECLRNVDAIKNLDENGEVCMVHSSK